MKLCDHPKLAVSLLHISFISYKDVMVWWGEYNGREKQLCVVGAHRSTDDSDIYTSSREKGTSLFTYHGKGTITNLSSNRASRSPLLSYLITELGPSFIGAGSGQRSSWSQCSIFRYLISNTSVWLFLVATIGQLHALVYNMVLFSWNQFQLLV